MATKAVIVVPSQGANAGHFEDTARLLKRTVYGNNALIVETTVSVFEGFDDIGTVSLRTADGSYFTFSSLHQLSSLVVISHSAPMDGPNLDFGGTLPPPVHQPWGTVKTSESPYFGDGKELAASAYYFWHQVGTALAGNGKIILAGCQQGNRQYAQLVANASNRRSFASKTSFAAGDPERIVPIIREIELTGFSKRMAEFHPVAWTP